LFLRNLFFGSGSFAFKKNSETCRHTFESFYDTSKQVPLALADSEQPGTSTSKEPVERFASEGLGLLRGKESNLKQTLNALEKSFCKKEELKRVAKAAAKKSIGKRPAAKRPSEK